jgi:hypothetical protein
VAMSGFLSRQNFLGAEVALFGCAGRRKDGSFYDT